MKALYPQPNGNIAIIFLEDGTDHQEVCKRVTPHNTPFLICEDSDLPANWSTSSSWECDFSNPSGIGMGAQRWFIAQAEANIVEILARTEPAAPTPLGPLVISGEVTEEVQAAYDAYLAEFAAGNAAIAAKHHAELVRFFAQQDEDEEAQLAIIEQMKAEVLQLEGVVL